MKLTPSKALKEIGLLKENGCYIKSTVEYKIVETALKDYEQLKIVAKPLTDEEKKSINSVAKRLKALEIIKEKGVFVHLIKQCRSVQEYNAYISVAFSNMPKEKCQEQFWLSKEEFDLLKEVLK